MVDIHNHVLFGVDDGAKSIEESLAMLKSAKSQGIDTVFATPHFYSFNTDIESYKSKVENNFNILKNSAVGDEFPEVFLGYEVHYFNDIYKSSLVKSLSLNNSEYLLLELDHREITDKVISDIEELRWQLGLKPIIAHIERYRKYKGYSKLLSVLDHENYFSQITADSLFMNPYKKPSLNLIKNNMVDFIASDAHNSTSRAFCLRKSYEFILNKFGSKIVENIFSNFQNIFSR